MDPENPPWSKEVQFVLELIARRLKLAAKVASAKFVIRKAINDPVREKEILQSIASRAEKCGLDPEWAVTFFQDQMDANKHIQQELTSHWFKCGTGPEGAPVNLDEEVRPVIDEIDTSILQTMVTIQNTKEPRRKLSLGDASAVLKKFELNDVETEALGIAIFHF